MFASKATGCFYHPAIHGPRLITIQDPAWTWPRVDVVLAPGESVWIGTELMTNSGDEPLTLHDVPDMSVTPDMLEVPNPACLIPEDALEITPAYHAELVAGPSQGKVIAWGDDGYPFLTDPPPPSPEELAAVERAWRNALLATTDGVVTRHRDELEEGIETTLSAQQYIDLQNFRRQLRNWPQGTEFPLAEHRPEAPAWLAEQEGSADL
jgi:hypothetical protein